MSFVPVLGDIIESAPFALLIVDDEGVIRFSNRGAESLFGYSRNDLIGRDIETLVPPDSRERHVTQRSAFLLAPTSRPMGVDRELTAIRKDGSRIPVEVALTTLSSEGKSFVMAVVVDVVERRRLEAEIRQSHRDLENRVAERTAELAKANAEKEALLAALELKQRELERLSREDPLTGLSNRRDFDLRLHDAILLSQRNNIPLSAAMFDLDFFKGVNDRFGHAVGDAVLKETADLMRRECRAVDIVSRYGGEEFALAFPSATWRDAKIISERIRDAFQKFSWQTLAADLTLTISAGVAEWNPGMESSDLLARADANLYVAKRSGRNRVESSCRTESSALPMDVVDEARYR
ncbi:MAG: diguanylate cyclase [Rudaea sp.]